MKIRYSDSTPKSDDIYIFTIYAETGDPETQCVSILNDIPEEISSDYAPRYTLSGTEPYYFIRFREIEKLATALSKVIAKTNPDWDVVLALKGIATSGAIKKIQKDGGNVPNWVTNIPANVIDLAYENRDSWSATNGIDVNKDY